MWLYKLQESDVKPLCNAPFPSASGTNDQLVTKLEENTFINELGVTKVAPLHERCTEAGLANTDSRHELVL